MFSRAQFTGRGELFDTHPLCTKHRRFIDGNTRRYVDRISSILARGDAAANVGYNPFSERKGKASGRNQDRSTQKPCASSRHCSLGYYEILRFNIYVQWRTMTIRKLDITNHYRGINHGIGIDDTNGVYRLLCQGSEYNGRS